MTINPGSGGQKFLPECVDKIRRLRELTERVNPECVIQVDGGIAKGTIAIAARAGASSFVAGTAVFSDSGSIAENIAVLRNAG